MNIKSIGINISAERLKDIQSVRIQTIRQTGSRSGVAGRDQADTSKLSRLMAGSTRELNNLRAIRPDKIAAFAGSMDQPAPVTRQVTDAIFEHMLDG